MTRTEQDHWRRWCDRRDHGAFRALIAAHEAFVYDFARRLTGHSADAEDLAQEAFLELAEADRDRPPAVGVRGFLGRRIVLGARMLKRASLTRQRLEPKAVEPAAVHPDDGVENRDAAETALAALDPESRQALVLRFLHGLSYAEVAHVLGVKEGAARVRVHRGLGKLKERFGSEAKASAGVAGLALFLPRKSFAASTTKAAVLLGGAAVMSSAKKLGIAAIFALVIAGSSVLWHVSRDRAATPERVESASRDVGPATRMVDAPEEPREAAASTPKRPPAASVPLDAAIPKGRGSVSGTLKFRDGTPAAGYSVSLSGSPAKIVETDAEGRFHLHDEWVDERDLCLRGANGLSMGIATVTMREDERVEIPVVLERAHTVSVSVVRQEGGQPAVGAHVRLYCDDPHQKQARWGWGDLGADGRIVFRHVPPGVYRLQVVKCPGAEATSREVKVETDEHMKIELKPARVFTLKFENLPAAYRGNSVLLMFERLTGSSFSIDTAVTKIDEDDCLRVDAPPVGRYQVTLHPAGSAIRRINLGEYIASRGALDPVVHRFSHGAAVVGTLVGPDGIPLAHASVQLEQAKARATTDASGKFEIAFARSGRTRILLQMKNRASIAVGSVEVPESGAVRADVRVQGTATIVGEFDRTASRWGGAVQLFRSGEERAIATWHFGTDRSIRFDYVEAGDYELRTWAVNAEKSSRALFVEKGARIDLGEVKLARLVEYPIRVSAPAGRKLPRTILVMVRVGESVQSAKVKLGADGTGVLTGAPAGKGKLWFRINGCQQASAEVHLREGMDPIVIALKPAPLTIDVPVRLEIDEGVEIPNLLPVRATGRNGSADASAFFVFPRHRVFGRLTNLVKGSYTLHIHHEGWKPRTVDVEITSTEQEPIRIRVERSGED